MFYILFPLQTIALLACAGMYFWSFHLSGINRKASRLLGAFFGIAIALVMLYTLALSVRDFIFEPQPAVHSYPDPYPRPTPDSISTQGEMVGPVYPAEPLTSPGDPITRVQSIDIKR